MNIVRSITASMVKAVVVRTAHTENHGDKMPRCKYCGEFVKAGQGSEFSRRQQKRENFRKHNKNCKVQKEISRKSMKKIAPIINKVLKEKWQKKEKNSSVPNVRDK